MTKQWTSIGANEDIGEISHGNADDLEMKYLVNHPLVNHEQSNIKGGNKY